MYAVEASGSYNEIQQEGGASRSSFPSSFHENAQTIQQVFSQNVVLPPIASERQMPQFMNVSPSIALYPSLHAHELPETEVQQGLDQVEIARRARSRELLMFLHPEKPSDLTVSFEFPQIAYMNLLLARDSSPVDLVDASLLLGISQTEVVAERGVRSGQEASVLQNQASASSSSSSSSSIAKSHHEKQVAHVRPHFQVYSDALQKYKSHKWSWQETERLVDLKTQNMTYKGIAAALQREFPSSTFSETSVRLKLQGLKNKTQQLAKNVLQ